MIYNIKLDLMIFIIAFEIKKKKTFRPNRTKIVKNVINYTISVDRLKT